MNPAHDLIIPANRNRVPYALLLYLSLTILISVGWIYRRDKLFGSDPANRAGLILVSGYLLLYTFITFADYLKSIFDSNASLSITETGLYDNLSIFSCGNIPWQDIRDARIVNLKMFKAGLLIIKVADNNKYITGKNILYRSALNRFIHKWGTPVVISGLRINYDLDDLRKIIVTKINMPA